MVTTNPNPEPGPEQGGETPATSSLIRPAVQKPGIEPAAKPPAEGPAADEPRLPSQEPRLALPADLPHTLLPADHQEQLDAFQEAASAAGLEHGTSQRLLNFMIGDALDFPTKAEPFTPEEAEEEMSKRWGSDFPRRLALVQRETAKLGEAFCDFLNDTGYGNEPSVLEALYRLASGELRITPESAQTKLDSIYSDPKHKFWDQNVERSERKRLVAEVRFLSAVAGETTAAPASIANQGWRKSEPTDAERAQSAARAEASELIRSGKLEKGTPAERAEAKQRFITLTAKL